MTSRRPVVVVVAEAAPMRGGIATFAETIVSDGSLREFFDIRLLNTGRVASRQGGRLNLSNVRYAVVDGWRTWRAARHADIVHLQLVADPGLPALRAAVLNLAASTGRAKLIAHVHSAVGNAGRPEFDRYGWRDRAALRTLRRAAAVCTVSDAGTETFRGMLSGTSVDTVNNAVNVAEFPIATRARARPTVLFVGVICRRKGTVELARAARILRTRGIVDWDLVVVGGQGPTPASEYEEIVAEFVAAGLGDSLVGPEYGAEVKSRLFRADIFVLPSYLEGQPIAILEAMAAGLPVLGCASGAVPDVVRHGIDGVVVEPGSPEALADALEMLLTDPTMRIRMGASARDRVSASHDLEQLSSRLSDIYRSVLDDGSVAQTKEVAL